MLGLINALIFLYDKKRRRSDGFTDGSIILKNIMLVYTFYVIFIQPSPYSLLLSVRAASLSSNNVGLICYNANIPI